MDRRRIGWIASGIAALSFVSAAAFSAYFRPDMLVVLSDAWAFCVGLVQR
jgi:hypothetical protein